MKVSIISDLNTKNYSNVYSVQILTSNGWINILPGHIDLVTDYLGNVIRIDGMNVELDSSSGLVRVSKDNILIFIN